MEYPPLYENHVFKQAALSGLAVLPLVLGHEGRGEYNKPWGVTSS
jgi:hypothetical protein